MPRQFSFPVVQEIFPPRPAPAPGAEPELEVARHTLAEQDGGPASQRALVAASLVRRP
jgi:hypothetical protein